MLLTIDIGNTTVAVGGFLGPELRFVRRLPSDRNMDAAACAARMSPPQAADAAAPHTPVPHKHAIPLLKCW